MPRVLLMWKRSMLGTAAAEYSFTKSNQAITFTAKSSIKVDGEKIQADPQLLFC